MKNFLSIITLFVLMVPVSAKSDLPIVLLHNRVPPFAVNDTVSVIYGNTIQLIFQGIDVVPPFEQLLIDTTSTPVNGSLTNSIELLPTIWSIL